MPHKDMNNMDNITKIGFVMIALIAGIVHWTKREFTNTKLWKKIFLFFYDALIAGSLSVFAGLITLGYTQNEALALGVGGIVGHLGNRVLGILEDVIKIKLSK